MRLLSVTVLGTALVAAGMLAPATGRASGDGAVSVRPDTARPGERVRVSTAGCGSAPAGSEVFAGRSVRGVARLRPDAVPGTYRVVARCGPRVATGRVRVAGRVGWPDPPPTGRVER